MEALVSIITPTYNSEKFITATIQSVQNQTYQNWEMIIVDDCSSDKTAAIVSTFSQNDARIKYIQLKVNSGTGVARNTGLLQAKGRYISFLDADDLWKPEKLQKQINYLTQNNLPFTFSFYECINEAGNLLKRRIEAPIKLTYKQLYFCNYVGNLTAIYDAEKLGKIPISKIRKRQDWMQWLTILKLIKIAQPVPEVLAYYRVRKNSISSSKIALFKYNFAVYRNFHKLNFGLSLLAMTVFLLVHFFIKPKYTKAVL